MHNPPSSLNRSKLTAISTGSADAVKAINVSVCRAGPTAIESVDSFNPEFTEQFFGQEQVIFGYRNLNISLRFAAHDLYPNVAITYDKKFPPLGQTTATDIEQVLAEYLPSCEIDLLRTSQLWADPLQMPSMMPRNSRGMSRHPLLISSRRGSSRRAMRWKAGRTRSGRPSSATLPCRP